MTIKTYLHSFRPKKEIFYSFLLDVGAIALILLLLIGYGTLLQSQSEAITNGKSVDEVKALLLEGNEQYNQQFLAQIQVIGLIFFIGGIIFVLASLFIYSLSSKLEWNLLLKKQSKYWRWNGLILVLSFFSVLVALLYAGFNLLIGTIFNSDSSLLLLFSRFIGIILLLAFVSYAFLANYSFNHSYKVWAAIGDGFSLIRTEWSKIWKLFLFSLFTFLFMNVLIYLLAVFVSISEMVYSILGVTLSLLFLSWMRHYYVQVLSHHE